MANCNYKVNIKDIQSKYSFKIFCSSDNAEIQAEIGNLEDLTTTAKNNLVSAINEVHSDTETNATAISGLQSSKEDKSNKVTSISSSSTDTQYPSAKCVYDSQETQDTQIETLQTNLQETQEELERYKTIYNALPKVSGTGESITLNNTAKALMKNTLDTTELEQETTTGKNLLPNIISSTTLLDVTITKNDDGSITLNGTASGQGNLTIGEVSFTNGETYTISGVTGFTDTTLQIYTSSITAFPSGSRLQCYDGAVTRTAQADENCFVKLYIYGGVTYNNVTIYPMIVKGSTSGDYEQYTGNQPSPSPSYPQTIHSISGDNTITIYGKNLISSVIKSGNMLWFNDLNENSYGFKAGTYTISFNATTNPAVYVKTASTSSTKVGNGSPQTFTMNEDFVVWIYRNGLTDNEVTDIQLEKSSQATTYEPYQSQTLPINLPVENLLDSSILEAGGISTSTGDDSTGNTRRTNGYIKVQPSQKYSFQYKTTSNNTQIVIYEYTSAKSFIKYTVIENLTGSLTLSSTTEYIRCRYAGDYSVQSSDIYEVQIELGSNANTYWEYGTTPIEYCEIGDYKNKFFKAIDGDETYDSLDSATKSSLTSGNWYLQKNIGKVVLDGSEDEDWYIAETNTNTFRFVWLNIPNFLALNFVISYFKNNYFQEREGNAGIGGTFDNEAIAIRSEKTGLSIRTLISRVTDLSGFKNWLSTHNTDVYYVLATPTYTPLPTSLQNQLEVIYNQTLSYKGQTNISQVNNDLYFTINSTALKNNSEE